MDKSIYEGYLQILKEELLPAMGCTEPISVAYAAALARDTLGALPEKVEISVSGNILKNVKSVVVPNTGGMKGVTSAAAAGIVGGDASKKLEVISSVTPSDKQKNMQLPFVSRVQRVTVAFGLHIRYRRKSA